MKKYKFVGVALMILLGGFIVGVLFTSNSPRIAQSSLVTSKNPDIASKQTEQISPRLETLAIASQASGIARKQSAESNEDKI